MIARTGPYKEKLDIHDRFANACQLRVFKLNLSVSTLVLVLFAYNCRLQSALALFGVKVLHIAYEPLQIKPNCISTSL